MAEEKTEPINGGGRISTVEFYKELMAMRQEFASRIALMDNNIHDMERRLLNKIEHSHQPGGCPPVQDHEKRLRELEEMVSSLKSQLDTTNKLLTFVASAVVLSVLGLLWSLLTGQAVLTFLR